MRQLLLALPLSLLPLAAPALAADAAPHHTHVDAHGHAALPAHEHGTAELDVAVDGALVELELRSPAANLLGFEHAPDGDADERQVAQVRAHLEQPQWLFGLPERAACSVEEQAIESPLLGGGHAGYSRGGAPKEAASQGEHTDIHARYRLQCAEPAALTSLELGELLTAYPQLQRVRVQLLGASGQRAVELEPGRSALAL